MAEVLSPVAVRCFGKLPEARPYYTRTSPTKWTSLLPGESGIQWDPSLTTMERDAVANLVTRIAALEAEGKKLHAGLAEESKKRDEESKKRDEENKKRDLKLAEHEAKVAEHEAKVAELTESLNKVKVREVIVMFQTNSRKLLKEVSAVIPGTFASAKEKRPGGGVKESWHHHPAGFIQTVKEVLKLLQEEPARAEENRAKLDVLGELWALKFYDFLWEPFLACLERSAEGNIIAHGVEKEEAQDLFPGNKFLVWMAKGAPMPKAIKEEEDAKQKREAERKAASAPVGPTGTKAWLEKAAKIHKAAKIDDGASTSKPNNKKTSRSKNKGSKATTVGRTSSLRRAGSPPGSSSDPGAHKDTGKNIE